MSLKTNKKSIIFGAFLALGFLLLGNLKSTLAVDGLMNGKMITGYSEDYIMWLQTYDQSTAPFFSDKFYIGKNGNVGIGKSNPGYALDVNGAINGTSVLVNGVAVGSGGSQWVSGSGGAIYYTGGNVGVGVTAPTVKLDNTGSFKTSLFATISSLGSGLGTDSVVMVDTNGGLFSTSTSNFAGGTNFWGGARNSNIWNGDAGVGRVGIGTTNPGQKLSVEGAGTANEDVVRINNQGNYASRVWLRNSAQSAYLGLSSTGLADTIPGTGAAVGALTLGVNNNMPIQFWNTTGGVASVKMTIDTNGNVGIGTTNPGSRLSIQNNAAVDNILSEYRITTGNNAATFRTSDTGPVFGIHAQNGGDIYIKDASDNVLFYGKNGGNVGISTTTPAAKLHVYGNGTTASLFTNGNVGIGSTNPGVLLDVNGYFRATGATISAIGSGIIMADSSGNLYSTSTTVATGIPSPSGISGYTLRSNGTSWIANSLLFNDGTNVGIGTTTPGATLDVLSANYPVIHGIRSTALTDQSRSGLAFQHRTSGDMADGFGATMSFEIRDSAAVDNVIADIGAVRAGADNTADIVFRPATAGTTNEKMRITSGGNVGIGITNPAHKLSVAGTSYLNGQITTSLSGSGNRCIYVDASGNLLAKTADCGTATGGDNLGSHIATQNIQLGNFWLSGDGGNEGIFVKSDGNVGIGTTNPGTNLHIKSTTAYAGETIESTFGGAILNLYDKDDTVYSYLNFGDGAARGWQIGKSSNSGVGPAGGFYIYEMTTGQQAVRLGISKGGNVGVGKTNPAVNLDVNGAINSGSTVNGTSICIAGDCRISWGNAAGWTVNGTEVYKTNTAGNVGIGVTAPGAKLDINGNAIIGAAANTGTTIPLRINGLSVSDGANPYGNYAGILFDADSSYTASARRHLVTNALGVNKFGIIRSVDALTDPALGTSGVITSGTADFVIDNAGNVGINQISPAAKLQVSGGGIDAGGTVNGTGLCIAGDCKVSWPAIVSAGGGNLWSGTTTGAIYSANSGSVGIGITAPADGRVVVVQSGLSTISAHSATDAVADGVANVTVLRSVDLDGSVWANARYDAYSHAWGYGGSATANTAMVISGGANVGIGITNPSYKLHVVGTSYLNGQITTSLSGSGNRCIYVDASGNLLAKTTDCGTATGGDNLGDHTATQNIKLGNYWLSGDGGNEGVFVKSDGNVGVGTTAPAFPLDVKGRQVSLASTAVDVGYTGGLAPAIGYNLVMTSSNDVFNYKNNDYAVAIDLGNSGGIKFRTAASGTAGNPITWTNAISILNNGNVGIGKSPSVDLDVNGAINSGSTVNGTSLCIANDCRTSWGGAAGWTVNGTEVYKTNTSGNVGIGTTNPGAKFEVVNTALGKFSISSTQADTVFFNNAASVTKAWSVGMSGETGAMTDDYVFGAYTSGGGGWREVARIKNAGNVGIATTTPIAKLHVYGNGTLAAVFNNGNVGVGTTNPGTLLDVNGYFRATGATVSALGAGIVMSNSSGVLYSTSTTMAIGGPYLPLAGDTMTGPINMGDNDITNVGNMTINHKLTVYTIDPLYKIKGINYSTYAASISGGVKEEYVGKIKISEPTASGQEYEAAIDFSEVKEGSDLWVWREVVEFNKDAVDIAITPYGRFAQVYYLIENNKLIFRSDRPVEISYRLIAKRFDWRDWPTRATDQSISGFEVKR